MVTLVYSTTPETLRLNFIAADIKNTFYTWEESDTELRFNSLCEYTRMEVIKERDTCTVSSSGGLFTPNLQLQKSDHNVCCYNTQNNAITVLWLTVYIMIIWYHNIFVYLNCIQVYLFTRGSTAYCFHNSVFMHLHNLFIQDQINTNHLSYLWIVFNETLMSSFPLIRLLSQRVRRRERVSRPSYSWI